MAQVKTVLQSSGVSDTDIESFVQKLKSIGGTTIEALRECSWEDAQECGLPRLIAKSVSAIFRAKPKEQRRAYSPTTANNMTPGALLDLYVPANDDAIAQALMKKSKGLPFIVFKDGQVDVETSAYQLDNIMAGLPHQPFAMINGVPHQTYAVGQAPERIFDENPLFPGTPLRLNGTCSHTEIPWKHVSQEVRQLVRVIVDSGAGVSATHLQLVLQNGHGPSVWPEDVWSQGKLDEWNSDTYRSLTRRFPKAALKFMDLRKTGNLPSLKLLPKSRVSGKSNDPFFSQVG